MNAPVAVGELPFQAALRQRCREPRAVPVLLGANVLVFVAMALAGAGLFVPDPAVHVAWGSDYGPLTIGGEPWRLFTCMFIHFGLLHLGFNMWALWDVGRLVERLYGTAGFLLLYGVAGLAGSVASVLWNPAVNSAGASGALFGVVGALLAFVFRPGLGLPRFVMLALRNSTLTFAGFSLALGASVKGIDNAAHLGGLAAGIVMGLLLARPLDPERGERGAYSRFALGLVAGATALALLVQPILHPSDRVAAESRFLLDLDWLAGREQHVVGDLQALGKLAQSRKITDAEFARRVRLELIPPWHEVEQRLAADSLPAASRLAPLQAAVREYVAARAQQLQLTAELVERRDPAAAQRISKQEALVEAKARAVRELAAR